MGAQERDLGIDGVVVALGEGRVVVAGQPDELAERCGSRRLGGRRHEHAAVVVERDDEQRAGDLRRGAPGR
jgi:hypothetical protein